MGREAAGLRHPGERAGGRRLDRQRLRRALVALGAHAQIGKPCLVELAIAVRIPAAVGVTDGAARIERAVVGRSVEAAGAQAQFGRRLALTADGVLVGLRYARVLSYPRLRRAAAQDECKDDACEVAVHFVTGASS